METAQTQTLIIQNDKTVSTLLKTMRVVFFLYVVSLATSMSGMELFSSLLILLMILTLVFEIQSGKVPGANSMGLLQSLPLLRNDVESCNDVEAPVIARSAKRTEAPPFWKPIICFMLFAIIGVLLSNATTAEKFYDISRMRFFLIYFCLFYYLTYFETSTRWKSILFWVALIVACYSVVQHYIPIDLVRPKGKITVFTGEFNGRSLTRVFGTFNHPLTFASIYLFYASLALSSAFAGVRGRWLILINAALLYLVVLWTQSRIAWLAIPATWLVFFVAKASWKTFLIGLCALAVFASMFFLDPYLRSRAEIAASDPARLRLWATNWEMFKEKPLFGVGYNNNERQCGKYIDKLYPGIPNKLCGHAHSNFLHILTTTGIFGAMAFLWLWGAVFFALFKLLKKYTREEPEFWLSLGLLAGFIGFHIQGLTQWNFGDAEVLHNVIFFWAVVAALTVKTKESKAKTEVELNRAEIQASS